MFYEQAAINLMKLKNIGDFCTLNFEVFPLEGCVFGERKTYFALTAFTPLLRVSS
jgi:hypothetical protein